MMRWAVSCRCEGGTEGGNLGLNSKHTEGISEELLSEVRFGWFMIATEPVVLKRCRRVGSAVMATFAAFIAEHTCALVSWAYSLRGKSGALSTVRSSLITFQDRDARVEKACVIG